MLKFCDTFTIVDQDFNAHAHSRTVLLQKNAAPFVSGESGREFWQRIEIEDPKGGRTSFFRLNYNRKAKLPRDRVEVGNIGDRTRERHSNTAAFCRFQGQRFVQHSLYAERWRAADMQQWTQLVIEVCESRQLRITGG